MLPEWSHAYIMYNFKLLQVSQLLIHSSYYFSTFYICHECKSSSKREKKDGNHHSSSRCMEVDFNRPFVRVGDPRFPRFPHTAAADSLHGPNPATRLFMGLHLFCPWSAGAGRVAPKGSRPRRGLLLSSSTRLRAHSTTGHTPTCGVPPLPENARVGMGRITVAL